MTKKMLRNTWVSLLIDKNIDVYFYSFEIEYTLQEVLKKINNKWLTHNICKIRSDNSIMRSFYCIAFMECMLAGKTLLDHTNLFSPSEFEKNDKIIYGYFKDKIWQEKTQVLNLDWKNRWKKKISFRRNKT